MYVSGEETPQPRGSARFIHVGSQRIPIPGEDAPVRQLLDFAALAAISSTFHPDVSRNPHLRAAATAAARAYLAQHPQAAGEAESLTMDSH